jgi:hypothetical protein
MPLEVVRGGLQGVYLLRVVSMSETVPHYRAILVEKRTMLL